MSGCVEVSPKMSVSGVPDVWAAGDIVTFPLYTVTQRPWSVVRSYTKERSQIVDQDETSVTIKAHYKMTKPLQVRQRVRGGDGES